MAQGLIDCHCHLLYGVDDGASSIDESIHMLEKMYSSGVRVICATSHYKPAYFHFAEGCTDAPFAVLQKICHDRYPDLTLIPGMEIIHHEDIVTNLRNGVCRTYGNSRTILLEFYTNDTYMHIRDGTENIMRSGFIPVLAHVERYSALYDMNKCRELHTHGVYFQVNASTVLEKRGHQKKFFNQLIEHGYVDMVAGDYHGLVEDHYCMKEAYDYIQKKYGNAAAKALFVENINNILKTDEEIL